MLTKTLAAAAAFSMLVAGGEALAAQKQSATALGPKEPIPYSQLNAYLKASPKTRASKDWWAGSSSASTGMSADTSATAPAPTAAMTSDPATTSSSMPPATDTAVNPAPSAAPPSMPMTPPTDAAPQQPGATTPPMTPPAEPK